MTGVDQTCYCVWRRLDRFLCLQEIRLVPVLKQARLVPVSGAGQIGSCAQSMQSGLECFWRLEWTRLAPASEPHYTGFCVLSRLVPVSGADFTGFCNWSGQDWFLCLEHTRLVYVSGVNQTGSCVWSSLDLFLCQKQTRLVSVSEADQTGPCTRSRQTSFCVWSGLDWFLCLEYTGLVSVSGVDQTGFFVWTFHALLLKAWLADRDSLKCYIVMMGRQIARMFSTFSLRGSLFLMVHQTGSCVQSGQDWFLCLVWTRLVSVSGLHLTGLFVWSGLDWFLCRELIRLVSVSGMDQTGFCVWSRLHWFFESEAEQTGSCVWSRLEWLLVLSRLDM